MIAQVVFDLPVEGPFDYLIPEPLTSRVKVGVRVKVSFGPRLQIGFVVALLEKSAIPRLKSVHAVCDLDVVFNDVDLHWAKGFSAYYGCSLGEALAVMFKNKENAKPGVSKARTPRIVLYHCCPDVYAQRIKAVIEGYPGASSFLILVADIARGVRCSEELKGVMGVTIGMRSAVFSADAGYDCVFMIDPEDFSYKQEQQPAYDAFDVLKTRSLVYGFDLVFVGVAPSVELMALVAGGDIECIDEAGAHFPAVKSIDLTNYKFVPGLLSPPVREALDKCFKKEKKSILILNRKGAYRITRCEDCLEVLKCRDCDSPLILSRREGLFVCRHCAYTLSKDTACPSCHNSHWRSMGIGIEQVQTEVKKLFPTARVAIFSSDQREDPKAQPLTEAWDILIATQAVLSFQRIFKAQMAALIDFDAELNRLDMRSAFNAFRLVRHIGSMVTETVWLQTRNNGHYVIEALGKGKTQDFYEADMRLRREFGFSPFKHWIKISWRGKVEASVVAYAGDMYGALESALTGRECLVTPPLADAVSRKRGQFRFNVMVQTPEIVTAMRVIQSTLATIKRRARVMVGVYVDP